MLRDFALDLVDDDGETMNAEEYLDQCLRPQQGYDAGVAERNKIRRALTTFFQNRTCCTLVRPLHNEEQLQQIDIVKWEEFRPEFCKDFRLLQSTLLQILKPKFTVPPRNSGGRPRPMNGQMYATLIGEYVKAVNSEGAPVVATAWEQVTANECLDAASKALANHKQLLNSFTLPSDATIAAEAHATALYSAMKSYDERAEGKNAASERAELQVKYSPNLLLKYNLLENYFEKKTVYVLTISCKNIYIKKNYTEPHHTCLSGVVCYERSFFD